MKGLFARSKTIRELKAIVRNLSTGIKKVTRNFSKALNIYCSWSRMNKRQLIKVVDWFLGNYSVETILYKAIVQIKDYNKVIKDVVTDLGLTGFDAYIGYNMIHPFESRNFTISKIYRDPDFEDKYFDEYSYDENGWIVVEKWIDNGRKIGNKRRELVGWYVALIQDDDYLVFEIDKNTFTNKYRLMIGSRYFECLKETYKVDTDYRQLSHQNKAVA